MLEYFIAFNIGFWGSIHCLIMCGPLAIYMYGKHVQSISHFFIYHVGRISSYLSIGIILYFFKTAVLLVNIQQYISLLLGVTMIFMALSSLFKNHKFIRIFEQKMSIPFQKLAAMLGVSPKKETSIFVKGAHNGLLPCGLVYATAMGSFSLPHLHQVLLYMFLFGLGALPMFFLLKIFQESLVKSMQIQKIGGFVLNISFLCIGILLILRGAELGIPYVSPALEQMLLHPNLKPSCH